MRNHDERGIALLLALLVLTLLVALILEFDAEARREYREAAAFRDNFKATTLARAALQASRAVLQQDAWKDRQTKQVFDAMTDLWAIPIKNYAIGDGILNAQIVDEKSKLNLNELAAMGPPTARQPKILRVKRLFELLQINPDLVDAIVDWIDQDEVPEPSGAETVYYQSLRPPYRAANAPLQTFDELRLVKGMTPEIVNRLRNYATVYPQEGDGRINLNTADPLVLQALDYRITQAMAGEIAVHRPFRSLQDVDRVTSFEPIAKELRLLNVYDVKTSVFSVRMSITVNDVTKYATAVLLRDEGRGDSKTVYFRLD